MQTLEDIHRIERSTWDRIAIARRGEAEQPLDISGLADYVRWSPGLAGADAFLGDLRGRRVLDYGCGLGKLTVALARSGARVTAFDLSAASIETTRRRLLANGVTAQTVVAAGETLPFADEAFDVVIGDAVLHHVDVELGAPELARVVRPGGRCAFGEPLGTNPLLVFARNRLPRREKAPRSASRPLVYDDIAAWGAGFSVADHRETQLLAMAERLKGYDRQSPLLRRWDEALLRRYPALRRYCRSVAIRLVR